MRALVVRQEFSSSNPVKGVDHDYSSMKIKILGDTPGRGREFHVTPVSMQCDPTLPAEPGPDQQEEASAAPQGLAQPQA